MRIRGVHQHTVWLPAENPRVVRILDQRRLPHEIVTLDLTTADEAAAAIRDMAVRGAPLIGVTAAYGLYLATLEAPAAGMEAFLEEKRARLAATRPTAVNLFWALDRMMRVLRAVPTPAEKQAAARREADAIKAEDIALCRRIGEHGAELIRALAARKNGGRVNVLTHCNAGWLACCDWGTATAPVYAAAQAGVDVHVWVDETRPRNQGASLTAFELGEEGIPHTLVADNAGGHLMQHGLVDLVIVGSDRTTACGDVANKIGTYLKALAAHDNCIPFYAALPSSTIDWTLGDGVAGIPIEERSADEVLYMTGRDDGGRITRVRIAPDGTPAANPGFDVTPARLVTGIITERGVCPATAAGLAALFPEHAAPRDGRARRPQGDRRGEKLAPNAL